MIAAGLWWLLLAFIIAKTTILAITSSRVMASFWIVRGYSPQFSFRNVKGVDVDQNVLGRAFGFGTVVVHGPSGMKAPIRCVAEPLLFQRAASLALKKVDGDTATQPPGSRDLA